MKRRLITLIMAAVVAAIPLMGAKGCGTQSAPPAVHVAKGVELHRGGLIYWVGPVPPRPEPGTYWQPRGQTRRGNLIWLKEPHPHPNGKARR